MTNTGPPMPPVPGEHPTEQYHPHVKADGHGPIMSIALLAAILFGSYWGFKSAWPGWFDNDPRGMITRYECDRGKGFLNAQMYVSLIADKNQTPFAVDRGPGMSAEIPAHGEYKFCANLNLEGVKPGAVSCEASIEVNE